MFVAVLVVSSCNVNSPDDFDAPAQTSAAAAPSVPTAPNEFDRGAASATLQAHSQQAKQCKAADGPTGTAKVKVTWAATGNVTQVSVQGAPFAGTSVGGCVAATFRTAKVPPFEGSPVSVTKSVTID